MQPKVEPTSTPDPGGYSQDQLMNMPLEQLEQLVLGKAKALGQAQSAAPAPGQMAAPAPAQGGDLSNEGMISPDLVMAATTALSQLGLPVQPSNQLSPDVVQALQAAMDKVAPGLYNLSNPDDLEDVLNGIATGELLSDLAAGNPAGGAPGGPAGPGGGLPGPGGAAGLPGVAPALGGGALPGAPGL